MVWGLRKPGIESIAQGARSCLIAPGCWGLDPGRTCKPTCTPTYDLPEPRAPDHFSRINDTKAVLHSNHESIAGGLRTYGSNPKP